MRMAVGRRAKDTRQCLEKECKNENAAIREEAARYLRLSVVPIDAWTAQLDPVE